MKEREKRRREFGRMRKIKTYKNMRGKIKWIPTSFTRNISMCSKYRVFRKKYVFSHFTATLPRLHIALQSFSMQCECTVAPIGWPFFVQPIADECLRGRGVKLSRILGNVHL